MLIVTGVGDHDHHDTGSWHPERPERLEAVRLGIADAAGIASESDVVTIEPREATLDELGRVHSLTYLRSLERLCADGGGALDPDTPVSPGSWTTARFAAGAGLAAIEALSTRGEGAAFVAVRPPGHHARVATGMGFCLVNNIAVAANVLADRGERVLIVDWDVHHGNGTQEIFWDDPRVMYASLHQAPMFPGTGRVLETGGPHAMGSTINVPLPAGTTGEMYRRAFDEVIIEAAERFAPTWVLVSAGFDAHRDDPLAEHALSAGDYAELTRRVMALAPTPGRLALFLEGGYDLGALRHSVAATVGVLVGSEVGGEAPTSGGPGAEAIEAARVAHRMAHEVEHRA